MANVTAWTSLDDYYSEEWNELTHKEKALMINYRRHLVKGIPIKNEMIMQANEIHERVADFHIGCMPGDPT